MVCPRPKQAALQTCSQVINLLQTYYVGFDRLNASRLALHFLACAKKYGGYQVPIMYFQYLHSNSLGFSVLNDMHSDVVVRNVAS